MQPLLTDADFAEILIADRAIVFIDIASSEQSRLSDAFIEEWERTSSIRVRHHRISGTANWMVETTCSKSPTIQGSWR
jgi:hypothetical protein